MNQDNGVPDFLNDGGFNWSRLGYFYNLSDFSGIVDSSNRQENVWFEIAQIVENAKSGDFSQVNRLTNYIEMDSIFNLSPAILLLYGDLANTAELEYLEEVMRNGKSGHVVYACEAAANSGKVDLIPSMLDAWKRSSGIHEHENIGYSIAEMLESANEIDECGVIASAAGKIDNSNIKFRENNKFGELAKKIKSRSSNMSFESLVKEKYKEVVDTLSSDTVIWRGKKFHAPVFTKTLLTYLTSSNFCYSQTPLFTNMRRRVEANTGVNCSVFFKNGQLDQPRAVDLVEDILDGELIGSLQFGKRYFFGHELT